MKFQVLEGDCREVMRTLAESSVDAIVCDPPYGLSFMGKGWDHGVPGSDFWTEALRVAKPGAHLCAFGGTRKFHRLTVGIEDAGWEIRDCLSWLYGSGFPKSLDVSKAIDKTEGHWRVRANGVLSENPALSGPNYGRTDKGSAVTSEARKWAGWGTALKPAWEPIILARKPFCQTVANNVRERGTGALNIDACRLTGGEKPFLAPAGNDGQSAASVAPVNVSGYEGKETTLGRWPANVVLDEEAAALLDEQSGVLRGDFVRSERKFVGWEKSGELQPATSPEYGESGGASRFFYTAKASRSEREAGLEHRPRKAGGSNAKGYTEDIANGQDRNRPVGNHHPTVKPLDLMQWLCRLVTPKGGLILDPFCGSGSTGRAAVAEGFSFIGIELDADYAEIARARIADYAPLFHDPEAA